MAQYESLSIERLKWECGNVADAAAMPHEKDGQVIFDAQWDDARGQTCELSSITIVNPELIGKASENPNVKNAAYTEYQLTRRSPAATKSISRLEHQTGSCTRVTRPWHHCLTSQYLTMPPCNNRSSNLSNHIRYQ